MTDINEIIAKAKGGCAASMWAIKARFQALIYRLSEANWYRIDAELFEGNCYSRIEQCVREYDPNLGDFAALVKRKLIRLLHQHIRRYRAKLRGIAVVPLVQKRYGRGEDEVDDAEEIEIIDGLAAVDDELITNDRIAALASGDLRKLAILNAWTYDGYNDSQTASLLAQRYGGNTESHRKYVSRFRTACRAALA